MLQQLVHHFTPNLARVSRSERFRASVGALLGIVVTAVGTRLVMGGHEDLPQLIAPMGASAVLLFAAPSSPLGQPWSIIGGNVSAALVGVTCRILIEDPFVACAIAVCLAIAVMFALRCLHPPGGAVAVVSVLASPAAVEAGYWFVLTPVALNSLLLLGVALGFNNLTGRRYPHLRAVPPTARPGLADAPPSARIGFTLDDLDTVLRRHDEVFDIDRDDLARILHETEFRAYGRRSGTLTCGDIMARDVATACPADDLHEAWQLLRRHRVKALPVVDADRVVVGVVTQTDFLEVVGTARGMPAVRSAARVAWARKRGFSSRITVETIMSQPVRAARADTTIAELVPLMADAGFHHLPVVDEANRLVGIVTQSDLIAALFFGDGPVCVAASAAA